MILGCVALKDTSISHGIYSCVHPCRKKQSQNQRQRHTHCTHGHCAHSLANTEPFMHTAVSQYSISCTCAHTLSHSVKCIQMHWCRRARRRIQQHTYSYFSVCLHTELVFEKQYIYRGNNRNRSHRCAGVCVWMYPLVLTLSFSWQEPHISM